MLNKFKIKLIVLLVLVSIIFYYLIVFLYGFDLREQTGANIFVIVKTLFILFNMGAIVYIILKDDNQKH